MGPFIHPVAVRNNAGRRERRDVRDHVVPRLFALNAETGANLRRFDPKLDDSKRVTLLFNCGVSYWNDGQRQRIPLGDQTGRLFSIGANRQT
jgi:glucose dehydrogenase